MKTLKYERENYEDILQLTETEQDAIDAYQSASFASINELLIADNGEYVLANRNGKGMTVFGLHNELVADKRVELERKGLPQDVVEREVASFEMETIEAEKRHIERLLDIIPNIYMAATKKSVTKESPNRYYASFNRGTSEREIDSYRGITSINNPLSTTTEELKSTSHFLMFASEPQNKNKSVCLTVDVRDDVPCVSMKNINGESEVLIAPFTTIEEINNYQPMDYWGGKLGHYGISLKPAELELLPEEESQRLREEIINETEEISRKMSSIYREKVKIIELERKKIIILENKRILKYMEKNMIFIGKN